MRTYGGDVFRGLQASVVYDTTRGEKLDHCSRAHTLTHPTQLASDWSLHCHAVGIAETDRPTKFKPVTVSA